jgi:hypothetical protein
MWAKDALQQLCGMSNVKLTFLLETLMEEAEGDLLRSLTVARKVRRERASVLNSGCDHGSDIQSASIPSSSVRVRWFWCRHCSGVQWYDDDSAACVAVVLDEHDSIRTQLDQSVH